MSQQFTSMASESAPFTPHWVASRHTRAWPSGPHSWAFFVVAQIEGAHQPVAAASSMGMMPMNSGIRGRELAAVCQRVIAIFADRVNHVAVGAELAFAARFYSNKHRRPSTRVKLPDLNPWMHSDEISKIRNQPWDTTHAPEFPFIAACLVLGIGFNAESGTSRRVRPEPLNTVYWDSSIEWGAVVFDITDLTNVRYGIIGFLTRPMRLVRSPQELEMPPENTIFQHRVQEEAPRPRNPLSAAAYMAKFNYSPAIDPAVEKILSNVPLVESAALDIVWPGDDVDGHEPESESDVALTGAITNTFLGPRSLRDLAVQKLVDSSWETPDFELSVFNKVRIIPGFQDMLRAKLLKQSYGLSDTLSASKLLALAYTGQEHVGLELLAVCPCKVLEDALRMQELANIKSLTLCQSSIRGTGEELAEALRYSQTLEEIYVLQDPTSGSKKEDSNRLLQEFLAHVSLVQLKSLKKIMFSASYTAAFCKTSWLPVSPRTRQAQPTPLHLFPVQHILIRRQGRPVRYINGQSKSSKFQPSYVYLGDALLRPERFAAGFMHFLRSVPISARLFDENHLLSLSASPALNEMDPLVSAEIDHIPAQSFAVWERARANRLASESQDDLSPVEMKELDLRGWTALVSYEGHSWHYASINKTMSLPLIRYALVKPCDTQHLMTEPKHTHPQTNLPHTALQNAANLDKLEVTDLEGFLCATAPNIDMRIVRERLRGLDTWLFNCFWPRDALPELQKVQPLAVLPYAEAVAMMLDFPYHES